MKYLILLFIISRTLFLPAYAMELSAPEVPSYANDIMPDDPNSFQNGLFEIIRNGLMKLQPDFAEVFRICIMVTVCSVTVALFACGSGQMASLSNIAGAVVIGSSMFMNAKTMILLGAETITEMAEYGKLLLPVMTSAMAAQGGTASSTALYAGTALFSTILSNLISRILIPGVYVFLILSLSECAFSEPFLKNMRDITKTFIVWLLKMLLTIFTAYMGITGVISGTTDAAALKATKVAISSVIPVVGGILSDASEAVLIGAGLAKNAAGIYGIFAILSIFVEPFFRIGLQYLMLKLTNLICSLFGSKQITDLISDFSTAMGMILGMVGAVCLLLLISTTCFLKGAV